MQHCLVAVLVATFATTILTAVRSEPESNGPASSEAVAQVAPAPATPPLAHYATVVKPFGASVRAAPSLEATGLYTAACGATLPVISAEDGWAKVQTEAGIGWIGIGRVALGAVPPVADCPGTRFISAADRVRTLVQGECLTIRSRPSEEASGLACIKSGHLFSVVDGPFDPGSGDDWFKVTSPATGTGWVPAESLFPL